MLPIPKEQCGLKQSFKVYILRTSANTLYIGQTNNLEKRLKQHRSKTTKSAKYMRRFESFVLVYTEGYSTRQKAMQREWQLKQWSKKKKEALVLKGRLQSIAITPLP